MNILTWNLEWASIRSARGAEISRIISSHAPSVMCLTELTLGMLPKDARRSILAEPTSPVAAVYDRRNSPSSAGGFLFTSTFDVGSSMFDVLSRRTQA